MIQLLVIWFVTAVSLAVTLGLLSWIYNAFGGDLGLTSWRRETVIAAVISLFQALLLWGALSLVGRAGGKIFPVAGVILMLAYKLTHLSGDAFEGTYDMDNSAIVVIAAVQFAILFLAGMLLTIHSAH
ncbi:MAG TPA: hypothetical protein VMP11_01440 [Verrucomicrobiae bacterium]|nr:hypothetical protein [Verrucomicrobiae bacterium]